MWRLGGGLAGAGGGSKTELARHMRVGIHVTARCVSHDRIDAGIDEFRHVAVAREGFVRFHRLRDRNGDGSAEAECTAGGGDAQPHAIGIEPPEQPEHRNGDQRAQDHAAQQVGIDRQKERDGVGVEDHDVDEVDRHHQLVVLELRQQDERVDHPQRHQRRGRRPPQQRQPEEIQQQPGEQEGGLALQVVLGRQHDVESGDVQQAGDEESRAFAA